MKAPYLLTGLLVAAFSIAGQATDKVYKWTDASGIVHFSDAPPPTGTNFENVRVVGQSTPVTAAPPPAADVAAEGEPQAGSDTPPPAKTIADNNAQSCEDAQARVTLLSSKIELSVNENGKNVPLDKAQREAELNIAKATAQSLCPQASN